MALGNWLAVGNTRPGCYLITIGDLKFRATRPIGSGAWTVHPDLSEEVSQEPKELGAARGKFFSRLRTTVGDLAGEPGHRPKADLPSNRMDWRIQTTGSGEFDELVLGDWLHVEKMDHGFYSILLGKERFWARWEDKLWTIKPDPG
jgi:hypothetical protein